MDTFERNHHHHHRFKFRLFFFPRKLLCRSLLACVRRAKRERAAHARPSIVATCSPACEFMNCFCCHLFSGRTARMTVTLPRYILNRYNAIYNRAHPSISSPSSTTIVALARVIHTRGIITRSNVKLAAVILMELIKGARNFHLPSTADVRGREKRIDYSFTYDFLNIFFFNYSSFFLATKNIILRSERSRVQVQVAITEWFKIKTSGGVNRPYVISLFNELYYPTCWELSAGRLA